MAWKFGALRSGNVHGGFPKNIDSWDIGKNRVFFKVSYFEKEKSYWNSYLIFGVLGTFYTKTISTNFSVSPPLHPQIWVRTEKVPILVFQFFSSVGCQIFFILHSQLEDYKGLLQWRFHIHWHFWFRSFGHFWKMGPKFRTQNWFSNYLEFDQLIKLKLCRQLEDH